MSRRRLASAFAFVSCVQLQLWAYADGNLIIDLGGNTADVGTTVGSAVDGRLLLAATSRAFVNPQAQTLFHLLAFDSGGEPIAPFGAGGRVEATRTINAVAARPDAGWAAASGFFGSIYGPTGALVSDVHLPSDATGGMYATALAVQPDGRIVFAGGYNRGAPFSDHWMLVRINVDGSLDTTFGSAGDGVVHKDASPSKDITGIHILPSGKILAIGTTATWSDNVVLGRFEADGKPDFAFGTNALVTLPCGAFCQRASMVVDSLGRIYVPGDVTLLQRLNEDGTPDNSYAAPAMDSSIRPKSLRIDSTGRVLLFAQRNNEGYITRLLPGGARDPSFGTAGEIVLTTGAGMSRPPEMVAGTVLPGDKPVALLTISTESDTVPLPTDLFLVGFTATGAVHASFGTNHVDADTFPNAFSFPDKTVPYGTTGVVSDPVGIPGINVRTSVRFHGGTTAAMGYSVGCTGTFTTTPGTLLPDDLICARYDASSQPLGAAEVSLDIGGRIATFTIRSSQDAADFVPDPFSFSDQTSVAIGTFVTSSPVTVTGLSGAAPVAVDGGSYSVGCVEGGYTASNGRIANGQTICVRHLSSGTHATAVSTTLAIGGVTDTFTSTTAAGDTTPDAFAFAALNDVQTAVSVTSGAATITGIDAPTSISVTGGEYSLGCASSWTAQTGTIAPAQQVCVRHTTAAQAAASVVTTLTVGGVSANFVSTTAAPPRSGGGGALSVLQVLALLACAVFEARRRRSTPR